jgi:hypothetical protein
MDKLNTKEWLVVSRVVPSPSIDVVNAEPEK